LEAEMATQTGYKASELGMIPQDWKIRRIGDFTDCTAGGTPSTQVSSYWGGEIPWMSSGELHLKQVYDVAGRITQKGLENSSTKFVPANSVLIGLAGQGKTRGTVAISKIPLCTNQSIAAIFPTDEFNSTFLFYNLENRYDELRALSTGDGGRGGLNLTIIRNVSVKFPPLPEQTAIATALSDTDALISSLQTLIAKKQAIKLSAMQNLLSGKIRLPEFALLPDGSPKTMRQTELGCVPEDWEVVELGEVLSYEQPGKYIIHNDDLKVGDIPVLTAGKTFILGYTIEDFNCYENYPVIIFDDFTTDSKLVNFRFKVKSSAMKMLKPKKNDMPIELIFMLLQNINFIVGDHKRHWISEFQHLKIAIPKSPTEQTAIAQLLSDIDAEIEALECRLKKTQSLKQGMMQALLTGKIRLPLE
jgi:type I restriction modification DNA specificity domain protein